MKRAAESDRQLFFFMNTVQDFRFPAHIHMRDSLHRITFTAAFVLLIWGGGGSLQKHHFAERGYCYDSI